MQYVLIQVIEDHLKKTAIGKRALNSHFIFLSDDDDDE